MISEYISEQNQEEAIKNFLDLLNRKPEECLSIEGLLELIGNYFQADRTYIIEQNESEPDVVSTLVWCKEGVSPVIANVQKIPLAVLENWKKHFRTYGSFYSVIDEVFINKYPFMSRFLAPQNLSSIILVPLVLGGKMVGLFGIDNPTKHEDFLLLVTVMSSSLYKELLSVREIEKSRIAEEKLKRAMEMANAANEAKSNFLFNMSHDIRTPMNAILGYSELIKKNIDEKEKILSYQEKIETSSGFLLSLINEVLDMARIESGKVMLDESCQSITETIESIATVFGTEAQKRKLDFRYHCVVKHNYVFSDITKIRQIYSNILSNAVKYTPAGGKISMLVEEVECSQEDLATIQITIQDTGIGISEEFLPLIFDSFSREQNTTKSGIIGTGLGMAIVKKLVDLMNGSIEVESKVGKGTKFVVKLTHKIADESYYLKQHTNESGYDLTKFQGKRILIVEDNDMNAEIASVILQDAGFVTERAVDGVDCIDILNKATDFYYDLILMDIQMPKMDGYSAAKMIRAMPEEWKKNIPIIALTANAFSEDKKKAFESGMNAHISKPINIKEMLKTIDEYF